MPLFYDNSKYQCHGVFLHKSQNKGSNKTKSINVHKKIFVFSILFEARGINSKNVDKILSSVNNYNTKKYMLEHGVLISNGTACSCDGSIASRTQYPFSNKVIQ